MIDKMMQLQHAINLQMYLDALTYKEAMQEICTKTKHGIKPEQESTTTMKIVGEWKGQEYYDESTTYQGTWPIHALKELLADAMGETVETCSLPYVGSIAARPYKNIFDSKPTTYTSFQISWDVKQPYTFKDLNKEVTEDGIRLQYIPMTLEQHDAAVAGLGDSLRDIFSYTGMPKALMDYVGSSPKKEFADTFTWNLQGPEPKPKAKSIVEVMKPLQEKYNRGAGEAALPTESIKQFLTNNKK